MNPKEKVQRYTKYCEYYNDALIDKKIVLFESHNSSDFADNLRSIAIELSENPIYYDLKLYICYVKESFTKIESFINRYGIRCEALIERESEDYFLLLATAGYLVTDVAYYSLFRKKEGQICISTWHGTPLKTLGFDYMEDEYVVGNQKRAFCLADYFICPNEYTWNCIRQSYQLDGLFAGKVMYGGYPRNSIFFDKQRRDNTKQELMQEYGLEGKKIVIYMPTWRGKVIQVDEEEQSEMLKDYLLQIDELLPDEYVMFVKMHRLNHLGLNCSEFSHIISFPEGYATYDVLNIADVLVTDYSSAMIDFLSTGKKIVLFCYDKDDYINHRRCYFDINNLPFPIITGVVELVDEICSPKDYQDEKEIEQFNTYDSEMSVQNLCRDIFLNEKNCVFYQMEKPSKNKALIFVGELSAKEETDSMFFVLDRYKDYQCYISYMNHLFKNKWYRLLQFPGMNQVPLFMYQGRYSNYTVEEDKVMKRVHQLIAVGKVPEPSDWRIVEQIGEREYERFEYQNTFDLFVRYQGLDLESLKWFYVCHWFKIIFLHRDMLEKARQNLEYKIYLERALRSANEIHYANREVYDTAETMFSLQNVVKIIENLY